MIRLSLVAALLSTSGLAATAPTADVVLGSIGKARIQLTKDIVLPFSRLSGNRNHENETFASRTGLNPFAAYFVDGKVHTISDLRKLGEEKTAELLKDHCAITFTADWLKNRSRFVDRRLPRTLQVSESLIESTTMDYAFREGQVLWSTRQTTQLRFASRSILHLECQKSLRDSPDFAKADVQFSDLKRHLGNRVDLIVGGGGRR